MFNFHVYTHPDEKTLDLLRAIYAQGQAMANSIEQLKQKIEELKNRVARNTNVVDSARILLQGLSQQLKDALAANDTSILQSTVSDLISQLDADTDELADAVGENTPATPLNPLPAPNPPSDNV